MPSMRPGRGGAEPGPGKVSRARKSGISARAKRDTPTAIPVVVTHFMNVRRDGRMLPPQARHRQRV